MTKSIWITRDTDNTDLDVWNVKPKYDDGEWHGDDWAMKIDCDDGQCFIASILGDQWRDSGTLCVEIKIASIIRSFTPDQKVVEDLRAMTKSSYCKATIKKAIGLLEGVGK